MKRAAVVRDASIASGIGQCACHPVGRPFARRGTDPDQCAGAGLRIERAVAAFAREPNRGLIVTGGRCR